MHPGLFQVLLLEDNEDDALLVRKALAEHAPGEFAITQVGRLADALGRIGTEHFDVMLIDPGLPDSAGLATVIAVATRAPALPLVVLTGTHDQDLGRNAIRLGAHDYLVKGESGGALIARELRYAIDQKRLEVGLRTANEDLERRIAERTAENEIAIKSLRESEARFRSLTEMSSDFYWESDAEHRFTLGNTDANLKVASIWRTPIGKRRWETKYLSPDEFTGQAHRETLDAHQPFRDFQLSRLGPDGTEHYLSVSGDPIFDASGEFEGYRGVGTDITERKRREENLLRFRQAMDATAEAIYLTDRASMRFIDINAAACTMLRQTREEIFALGPEGIQQISRAELERIYDSVIAGGAETEPVEMERRRKDGSRAWIELRRRALPFGKNWTIVTVMRDIAERKRSEQELRAAEEQFRGVVEQSIAGIYIIQDGKLAYVNPRFAEIFGYDSVEELIGRNANSVVAEGDRDAVVERIRQRAKQKGPSISYEFTGLRKDGATIDIGIHGARATHRGRPAVIGLAQDISEKKRAEEEIRRYVAQLETAFMSTVKVATTISEFRDPYTVGHERRVAEIAVVIGAQLGFDARRQEGLRVAGHLHDIGKITIPSEILSKPGRLSAIELQLIKGHSQASYDVLKEVEFPWPVARVALEHHERMDGSGYPQGLKGEAILLESRIMAVADVIEAMASHRPYRPGLGVEAALAEIERGRGSAYDPQVADACLRLFREKRFQLPD